MKAWQHAACYDARFIQTQLDVGHAMYLKPAMKYAASVGVHSNLGKAFFYGKCVYLILATNHADVGICPLLGAHCINHRVI